MGKDILIGEKNLFTGAYDKSESARITAVDGLGLSVSADADASGRGIDHRERRHRAGFDPQQPDHVLGLGKAYPLATDGIRQCLEVDARLRRDGDQPEVACRILQEQVLGMGTGNVAIDRPAFGDGEHRHVFMRFKRYAERGEVGHEASLAAPAHRHIR